MSEYFDPFKEYENQLANGKAGLHEEAREDIPSEMLQKESSTVYHASEDSDFGKKPPQKKKKKAKHVGAYVTVSVLCLILPLFLLANLFISNYIIERQQKQFELAMAEKVAQLESNFYDQITYNADLTAYYVGEKCLDQSVEIFAISQQTGISQGTGFVISQDGYLLTNAHVVIYNRSQGNGVYEDVPSETINLTFPDNDKVYEATCVAFDTEYDMALLKFKNPPQGLNVAEFANSVNLSYGEPCVAIGNAKSKGISVTDGIISSPMVNFKFSSTFVTASIQHSAPINSGNSGGPLYNMFGQVIGINTFKIESSDSIEGMAYAMPSVIIKDWVNSLGLPNLAISFVETPGIGGDSIETKNVG